MTWLRELFRYGIKGAAGTAANVALMTALVELGGIQPATAAIASTATLLLAGYVVMSRWVFPNSESPDARGHLWRGAKYYAVILSGKGVNYALFLGLLSVGVWYPAAWLLGSVTVFFGTFSANRYVWTGGSPA